MPEYDLPWDDEIEEDEVPQIDPDLIELGADDQAVSERVRHGQIKDKTRKEAERIIQTLDRRRERRKLSKAELARKVKKQPAALRRFFRKDSNPELFTLLQIADALDAEIVIRAKKRRKATIVWRDDPEGWDADMYEH